MRVQSIALASRGPVEALVAWLRAGGARVDRLAVRTAADGRRGAVASAAIPAGEPVLAIPHERLLTHTLASRSPIGRALERAGIDPADAHTCLAAFLIAEARDRGSRWRPYLDALPTSYPHMPCFLDDVTLALLDGTSARARVDRQRADLAATLARLRAVPALADLGAAELAWARLTVLTRVFRLVIDGRAVDALVPMADLLEHAPAPEAGWAFDDVQRALVVTTVADVVAGAPVRQSYGAKSDARLFVNYGFCLGDNDADEAVVAVRAPDERTPACFAVTRAYADPEVQRMFAWTRLAVAGDGELALHGFRTGDGVPPITSANERAALTAIADGCRARLAGLPGTIADDEALLAGAALSPAARACVTVRRGEKRVLAAFVELARDVVPMLHLPRTAFAAAALTARPRSPLARAYLTDLIDRLGGADA